MCFSALSASPLCDLCGRHHPPGLRGGCVDIRCAREVADLDRELAAYLASPEARFFDWLAHR